VAYAAGVFAESDVTHVVKAVFDAPVIAPALRDPFGGRPLTTEAGNRVVDFHRSLSLADGRSNATTHLSQTGPVQMGNNPSAELDFPLFQTAVPFALNSRSIEMFLPLLLGVGGKRLAGNQQRCHFAGSVGCP